LSKAQAREASRSCESFRFARKPDGPVKTAILGGNNARLYKYPLTQKSELAHDRFAALREEYEQGGGSRSNLAYGYVRRRLASV
jgi:hypothetical protein